MTIFSAIPSGDVDPDSPVTTGLITKLRDNHLAQAEGNGPDIINLIRASLLDSASGSELSGFHEAIEETPTTASYQKMIEFITPYGGTLSFAWDFRRVNALNTAFSRIYRNGAGVGTAKTTTSQTFVGVTDTVSGWSAGDLIQLYAYHGDSGSTTEVQRFKISEAETRFLHDQRIDI